MKARYLKVWSLQGYPTPPPENKTSRLFVVTTAAVSAPTNPLVVGQYAELPGATARAKTLS